MSYKGLCVGGVRAGEWVSKDFEAFSERVYVTRGSSPDFEPIFPHWSAESIADGTAGIVTDYVHVRGGGGCDFWVPKGKDRTWAMQELVRCYRREHLPPNPEADPE